MKARAHADVDAGGSARRHRAPVLALLALVGALLVAGFTALGVWQMERRAWKLDLIERVTQRLHAPPRPAPAVERWSRVSAAHDEYLPVRLSGHWLQGKSLLVQASTHLGAGYWVLTPLARNDETQVLVNRGFLPQAERAGWLAGAFPAPGGEVTVEGLLRISEPGGGFLRQNQPAEGRWYSRDVAAMQRALQLPHAAPFFVDAGLPSVPAGQQAAHPPAAQTPWPRAGLTVVQFHNSHLVYALTWFAMALMSLVGSFLVARYELRLRIAA